MLAEIFSKVLNMSLTANVVILVVYLARFLLQKAPKIYSYMLWALVLFRLLCPVSFSSSYSLIPEKISSGQIVSGWEDDYVGDIQIHHDNRTEYADAEEAGRTPVSAEEGRFYVVTGTDGISAPNTIENTVMPKLAVVWLLGIAAMSFYSTVSYVRVRKRTRVAVPFRKGIYLADDIDTPFVLGLFRPVIYLPGTLERAERKYIIAHEKHHIRRGDHIFKALGFLALSIHWFNPLVWLAFRLAERDMEMSCDEAVIRKLGETVCADYSASLMNLATGRRMFAGTPLAFGEGDPVGRIRNLAKWKKPAFWVIFLCVVLCAVLAVCLLTDPAGTVQESPVSDNMDMTLMYFNRTLADVLFFYKEGSEYQISEAYLLERWNGRSWQELPRISEKHPEDQVAVDVTETADLDAWSILRWENIYGRLPDGSYRIRKEIIIDPESDHPETEPVYVEFTIGGAADAYITYTLEDITPTGANLFEQETVDDSVVLIYGEEGFWLETMVDGKWVYLEPTENGNAVQQKTQYITALHYPSSHIELDWSDLYGELPDGTYRIAREITNTDEAVMRLCTAYAEFTMEKSQATMSPALMENETSKDWGVSIKPDRVSRTGATALFAYDGSVPGEEGAELTYGDFLSLDRMVDGKWIPVEELAGYDYYVGDSSYPVVDGYGMVHEWGNRFGELPDGTYRLGKLVTLTRLDGTREEQLIYGEFSIPDSMHTGPIPLEDLPEKYSAEQAMLDGCLVLEDGVVRENTERFQEFASNSWNGQPAFIRIFDCHYGAQYQWSVMDLTYDGDTYSLSTGAYTRTYHYLKHFTGEKAWENANHDGYEYFVLVNDDTVIWQDIRSGKLDEQDNGLAYMTVCSHFTYLPKRPQLPDNPDYAILEFQGSGLVTVLDADRLEKLIWLFEDGEYLGYEPKTHSIGMELKLIFAYVEEDFVIELDPDADLCRINGAYVWYGKPDEPDYILRLWECLGITQWPDLVYSVCENALRP